jgi:peptide/nickel transport system substrate-binding protein
MAGAAGLALAGCGDDGGKAGTSPAAGGTPTSEKITQGGTVRFPLLGLASFGLASPVPTLYPFETIYFATHVASAFHYSRLLRPTGGPKIEPTDLTKLEGDIAAKWEQPDNLTYLFTLKPNVRWHDKPPMNGRVATATDFLKSYEAFVREKASPGIAGPNPKTWTDVVDRITAPDERTIKITMKAPFAPFLATRAGSDRDMWLVPVETIESGQVRTNPVGTGPYVFDRHEPGVAIAWHKHPAFHDAPLPNFDRVEADLIFNAQQIVAALQGGGYDLSGLGPSIYKESHPLLDPKGTDVFFAGATQASFKFNFDNKPFDDLRVRQALSMAFDREGALKLQDSLGRGNWSSFVPPALAPFYVSPRDNNKDYGASGRYWIRNIKDAKDLLKAATGSDTVRFKLLSSFDVYGAMWKQTAEIAADTIREAGFESELVFEPYASYFPTTFLGKMGPDSIGIGPQSVSRDPDDQFLLNYWSKGSLRIWGGTPIAEQPALDAMFEKQRTILDAAERESYIKAIQYKMSESLLVVPIHANGGWSYAQPWVKNAYLKFGYTGVADGLLKAYFTPERLKKG